jgi:hypothetical protein
MFLYFSMRVHHACSSFFNLFTAFSEKKKWGAVCISWIIINYIHPCELFYMCVVILFICYTYIYRYQLYLENDFGMPFNFFFFFPLIRRPFGALQDDNLDWCHPRLIFFFYKGMFSLNHYSQAALGSFFMPILCRQLVKMWK